MQSSPDTSTQTLLEQGHCQMLSDGHRPGNGERTSGYGDQQIGSTEESGKRRIVGYLLPDADGILENEVGITGLEECPQQTRTF
jgi:hypothetical protein